MTCNDCCTCWCHDGGDEDCGDCPKECSCWCHDYDYEDRLVCGCINRLKKRITELEAERVSRFRVSEGELIVCLARVREMETKLGISQDRITTLEATLRDVKESCDAECAGCGAYYVAEKALVGADSGTKACASWEDHEWEKQPSSYNKCTRCPFEKTDAEIA